MPFSGLRSSVICRHSAHSPADQTWMLLGRECEQKEGKRLGFGVSPLPGLRSGLLYSPPWGNYPTSFLTKGGWVIPVPLSTKGGLWALVRADHERAERMNAYGRMSARRRAASIPCVLHLTLDLRPSILASACNIPEPGKPSFARCLTVRPSPNQGPLPDHPTSFGTLSSDLHLNHYNQPGAVNADPRLGKALQAQGPRFRLPLRPLESAVLCCH